MRKTMDIRLKVIAYLLVALFAVMCVTMSIILVDFAKTDPNFLSTLQKNFQTFAQSTSEKGITEPLPDDVEVYRASIQPLMKSLDAPQSDIRDFIRESNPHLKDKTVERIVTAINYWCDFYKTPRPIIYAMIYVESRFHYGVDSYLGEIYGRGLAQVSDSALKDFNSWTGKKYTTDDMYIIEKNIEVALWAFNQNYYYGIDRKSVVDAVIAYNVGAAYTLAHHDELHNKVYRGKYYGYKTDVYETLNVVTTYF